MLKKNGIKAKLAAGEELFGILNSVASPLLCEMFAAAGYDFVIIDTEHLLRSPVELEHSIRAAEAAGITALVRIPLDDHALIGRALDSGAQGIVIPRVSNAAQARVAIEAVRFPPLGRRGITGGRPTGFGQIAIDDYTAMANREVMLVLMIEDAAGARNLPEILAQPGIDMILEGALDLSIAMGHGSDIRHAAVQSVLTRISEDCAATTVPFCAVPRFPGQLETWRRAGVRAFLAGEDRGILFRQLSAHLKQLKSPATSSISNS
ncbi:HpcH/HpaI aldolase family protein [Porticoccus sp.]